MAERAFLPCQRVLRFGCIRDFSQSNPIQSPRLESPQLRCAFTPTHDLGSSKINLDIHISPLSLQRQKVIHVWTYQLELPLIPQSRVGRCGSFQLNHVVGNGHSVCDHRRDMRKTLRFSNREVRDNRRRQDELGLIIGLQAIGLYSGTSKLTNVCFGFHLMSSILLRCV